MHVTIPPTEKQRQIEAVKYAVDRKRQEVEGAMRTLDGLRAELRGLQQALEILDPPKVDPPGFGFGPSTTIGAKG